MSVFHIMDAAYSMLCLSLVSITGPSHTPQEAIRLHNCDLIPLNYSFVHWTRCSRGAFDSLSFTTSGAGL